MIRNLLPSTLLLAFAAMYANAATVSLTFEGVACHDGASFGPTNAECTSSGQVVGSDYGTTTGLTVQFVPHLFPNQGPSAQKATNFGAGSDFGVVLLGASPEKPAEIVFTPAAGFEVSFVSFARRRGTSTLNQAFFQLLNPNGAEIYSLSTTSNLTEVVESVGSPFFSGPITFRYGSTQGATVVDDITLEVRAVPEPTTWTILLGFAGMAGWAVKRKRT